MVRVQSRYFLIKFQQQQQQQSSGNSTLKSQGQVYELIQQAMLREFGERGVILFLSRSGVKYYNPTTRLCIFRVARETAKYLRQCFSNQLSYVLSIVHVSGCIRRVQVKILDLNKALLLEDLKSYEAERQKIQQLLP
ncbi:hypothetical protein MP228_003473 [Amoeboaphelidium protococcarum]|nr:hypothetical protein MP228_003473 [Amoeboaphelidium protococcarum]